MSGILENSSSRSARQILFSIPTQIFIPRIQSCLRPRNCHHLQPSRDASQLFYLITTWPRYLLILSLHLCIPNCTSFRSSFFFENFVQKLVTSFTFGIEWIDLIRYNIGQCFLFLISSRQKGKMLLKITRRIFKGIITIPCVILKYSHKW